MSLDHDLVVAALPSYQIEQEIGRGGWGVVLSATHRELGRPVAIKQLPRAFGADPAVRTRFKDEARLVASLAHPHIVPIYDFVEHDGLCLIVMELLTGGTLWDRFLNQGVPLDQACGLMLAACTALRHAHDRGILHRDIKPENFLFSDTGTMKLGDFGIAKVIGQSSAALTVAGSVMGTPAYMAPEQALGLALGPPTDIYSIGVMLYELACGELPFPESEDPLRQLIAKTDSEPRPITDVRPDLHSALAAVTMRSIARRPEDRYATAEDLGTSLARAATRVFGPGWLRRSRVEVMSASDLIAITEQAVESSEPPMRVARLTRPTTTIHVRIGDLLRADGVEPLVAPAPPAPPAPTPEVVGFAPAPPAANSPVTGPPAVTIAPDWAGAVAAGHAVAPAPGAPTAWDPAAQAAPPGPPAYTAPPAAVPPAAVPPAAVPPAAATGYGAPAEYASPPAYAPPAAPPAAPVYAAPAVPYQAAAQPPSAPPGSYAPTPNYQAPTHPTPSPMPAGTAETSGSSPTLVLAAIGVVLLLILAGGSYALTRDTETATAGPGTDPAALATSSIAQPPATDTSATSTSTSTSSTTSTKAPNTIPTPAAVDGLRITELALNSSKLITITWEDTVDPEAEHVLLAYTKGSTQQFAMTSSKQPVAIPAGTPYCFQVAAKGTPMRYTSPSCINGADAAALVNHASG